MKLSEIRAERERRAQETERAFAANKWDIARTARALSVSEFTVRNHLKLLGYEWSPFSGWVKG